MHAQQQARAVAERALVIGKRGAVGGAYFAEYGAAFRHDIGNTKRFADLDQLAAGDEDFASAGESGQNQENRGGIVVDDDSRFRASEAAQERGRVNVAAAAGSGLEIEFEIGVAAGGGLNALERSGRKGGAAQVGVEDDACGIDDGRSEGASNESSSAATASSRKSKLRAVAEWFARRASRARARTTRAASTRNAWSRRAASACRRGAVTSSSTEGSWRSAVLRSSAMESRGLAWGRSNRGGFGGDLDETYFSTGAWRDQPGWRMRAATVTRDAEPRRPMITRARVDVGGGVAIRCFKGTQARVCLCYWGVGNYGVVLARGAAAPFALSDPRPRQQSGVDAGGSRLLA